MNSGRRATAVVLAIFCLAITGCGQEGGEAAKASPSVASQSAAESEIPQSECEELIKSGWTPATGEIEDISFDPETGLGTARLVGDEPIVFSTSDPLCAQLPVVGKAFARLAPEARKEQARECRDLERELETGEVSQAPGKPEATLAELQAYYDETC